MYVRLNFRFGDSSSRKKMFFVCYIKTSLFISLKDVRVCSALVVPVVRGVVGHGCCHRCLIILVTLKTNLYNNLCIAYALVNILSAWLYAN